MAAPKRPSLVAQMKAAKERLAEAPPPEPAPVRQSVEPLPAPPPGPPPARDVAPARRRGRELTDAGTTTAVHIPREDLALLRRVAVERANRDGGRPSVSDVLRGLIERHRAELERETAR